MATFDLGRVTPLYKRDYSASASYELNDVVLYNGNLYWHIQATATVGIPPTDTTVWKLAFSDEGVRAEIRGYADDAQTSKTAAATSASQASASASNASASASQAALSAQAASTKASEASTSAQTASTKASEATASAQSAASSAQTATDKATLATNKAQAASESATLATAKASAAATSETNAAASAQTATTKASEAAASATSAQEYDESAQASAVNAQTAQGLAETAQTAAETAQGLAEDARDLAQQYAESIDPEHIYSTYPTDTAEGSIASFADGADDIPLKSLVVNIDPVQSGSGDPSPDNVRPITGWTGVNVKRMGVNLWDEEWESGTLDTSTGEKVSSSVTMRSKNFISIKPGMKCIAVGSYNVVNTNSFIICYYDKNGTYVSYRTLTRPESFEVPSDERIALMRFAYRYYMNDSGGVYNHDVSVNCPSTYTAYAPYQVETYSITFPSEAGTVYGGTLNVTTGVLTVDMAIVDMGTLNWTYNSAQQRIIAQVNSAKPAGTNVGLDGACSVYKVVNTGYKPMPDKSIVIGNNFISNSYAAMVVHDEDYTDAETFKTAVSGQMLVFPIKTPTTYQLTPIGVTTLLGTNNIWADTGDSTVKYRADTKLYIKRLTEPDADMIADANIVSGQYFMVGNNLYLATSNIASGGQVIVGTNATRKSLSEALNEINQ